MKRATEHLFEPLRSTGGRGKKKKSALVAQQILQAIMDDKIKPNDRLPPERDISSQMQVSRTVVREALNALKIENVIDVQVGNGTYVSMNLPEKKSDKRAVTLLEESESPFEIWEARRYMEKAIGESSIERANVNDIRRIKHLVKDMAERVEILDLDGYWAAHKQYHSVLIEMAGNSVLTRLYDALLEMSEQILTAEPTRNFMVNYLPHSLAVHQEILEAISNRDKNGYRAAIDRHYGKIISFYLDENE